MYMNMSLYNCINSDLSYLLTFLFHSFFLYIRQEIYVDSNSCALLLIRTFRLMEKQHNEKI
jgi:hypothetical protein